MSFIWSHTFKYGFWWLFGCSRVIGNTFPTTYKLWELFGEKNIFRIFLTFLKQFLLHFSLKMKQKWIWKNRKSDFFKNEALNQKTETVKPLVYVLTVSLDYGDPPDLKLAMPPASNSAHENHCFYSPSKLLELQGSFSSPKIDFWKCLSNGPIRSNMASDDFLDVLESVSYTHLTLPTKRIV